MRLIQSLRSLSILPWLMGGLLTGIILSIGVLLSGVFLRNRAQSVNVSTPVLTIVTAPTQTPSPVPTNTQPKPDVTTTPTVRVSNPGEIGTGQLVEIFGTGGDNLRLRARPGLDSAIAFLGVESEVFEVLDGPQELDGYQWWYVRNPYNPEKTGWTVSAYLRPLSSE